MTDEQKRQMVSAVLNAFIALLVSVAVILGYTVNYPQPVMLVPGGVGALSTNQKIVTDRAGQILYVLAGGKIDVNSGGTLEIDSGATETHAGTTTYTGLANLDGGIAVDTSNFTVSGTTGATVIAGALTLSSTTSLNGAANMNNYVINNIGNASTDFDASGGLTASGGFTGTVNTAAQTSITSLGTQAATLNMGNNVISNIGNASTDFDTSGGLTAAGGFTGTVNTAAQPNITSLGTLPTATITTLTVSTINGPTVGVSVTTGIITDLTTTNVTGTLATAAQPNVTSLGTQASALNMGNAVINNIGNAGTDFDLSGGLTVAGGITGTVNTAAQPNITSVGTLPSATITDLTTTNITGTLATASQPNVTNLGAQTYLTATNFTLATVLQPWLVSGTQGTYTSSDSITFTAPTTPTKCFMNPSPEITATYTITSTGFSVDTTTRSTPVYWMCLQ